MAIFIGSWTMAFATLFICFLFLRQREPNVFARGALWSPATGRVEAESLVRALQRVVDAHDGIVLRGARLVGGTPRAHGFDPAFRIRPA